MADVAGSARYSGSTPDAPVCDILTIIARKDLLHYWNIVQLAERTPDMCEVIGSSPIIPMF